MPLIPAALDHHPCKTDQPAAAVLLGEACDFGLDGFIRLPRHEAGRADIDEPQQRERGKPEQSQVQHRDPERRSPE